MSVDIIGDLCDRFADADLFAVCAALGVHTRDWPLFARWATDFLDPKSVEELYAHLDVMIAERCAVPGGDLLSDLIGLEIDGDGLTVDELHTIVAVLLAGAKVG